MGVCTHAPRASGREAVLCARDVRMGEAHVCALRVWPEHCGLCGRESDKEGCVYREDKRGVCLGGEGVRVRCVRAR
jgi:hypothetical protein